MDGRSRRASAPVARSGSLRVLVVTDAGPRVGLGHLMRTRAVVEALRARRPARAIFLGRFGAREARWVHGWGYALRRCAEGERSRALRAELAKGGRPDVILFDAYRRLESELRLAAWTGTVVVLFDDGNLRGGRVPVTLRIGPLLPAHAAPVTRPARLHLAGPRHLCLRPEIVDLREHGRGRSAAGAIVVSLGGGAAPGLSRLLRRLRTTIGARDWVVLATRRADVDAGSRRGDRRATARPSGQVRVICDPRAAARALAAAPAVVCAAGTTAWEAACLGVPAVLWPRVANQRPIARALDGRAAVVCSRSVDLPQALATLLKDRTLARRLSRAGRRMVDGRGARRIAQAILREWVPGSVAP